MNRKHRFLKIFGVVFLLGLATLSIAACGSAGVAAQGNNGQINICHASGSATNPYNATTIDLNELNGHANHKNDLIPAPAAGCPKEIKADGNHGKLTICHATGSATNPYNQITIGFNALRGHRNHKGDIIPAPQSGCPLVGPTPTITVTPRTTATPIVTATPAATIVGGKDGKITICHATGSSKNPYVIITISVNGLNGHSKHARDIIPAPAGGCPQ